MDARADVTRNKKAMSNKMRSTTFLSVPFRLTGINYMQPRTRHCTQDKSADEMAAGTPSDHLTNMLIMKQFGISIRYFFRPGM